jgi:hypothetical protein
MARRRRRAYEFVMASVPRRSTVQRALHALGRETTLGDLVAVTALPNQEVEHALVELMRDEQAHLCVSEGGDLVYHLGWAETAAPRDDRERPDTPRATSVPFDRKTVQLIRAREGVLSIAELVEHTGLRVSEARREMARLAERFGGVPHASLDGHVVHAFPELMASAHGRFPDREPRPAWVRVRPPVVSRGWALRRLVTRRREAYRRHALGLVVQTALAGKGVVSLQRTVEYLRLRTGRRVAPAAVEAALRELAADFGAPATRLEGDLFFGFRNVKRQFLASQVLRRQLRLARIARGETVFDSADSVARAGERELEAFDRDLRKPMTAPA